jgi:hypothetical protein
MLVRLILGLFHQASILTLQESSPSISKQLIEEKQTINTTMKLEENDDEQDDEKEGINQVDDNDHDKQQNETIKDMKVEENQNDASAQQNQLTAIDKTTKTTRQRTWQSFVAALPGLNKKKKKNKTDSDIKYDDDKAVKKLLKSAIASALASGSLATVAGPYQYDVNQTTTNDTSDNNSSSSSSMRSSSTKLGWLHSTTPIVAELSVALSLYRQSDPTLAINMALSVLDTYGDYGLSLSSKNKGDLLFQDMECDRVLNNNDSSSSSSSTAGVISQLTEEIKAIKSNHSSSSSSSFSSSSSSSSNENRDRKKKKNNNQINNEKVYDYSLSSSIYKPLIILPTSEEKELAKQFSSEQIDDENELRKV